MAGHFRQSRTFRATFKQELTFWKEVKKSPRIRYNSESHTFVGMAKITFRLKVICGEARALQFSRALGHGR